MPALKREGLGEKLNVDVTGDDWQFTLIAFIAFAQYLESFVNIWPRHSSALEYWKCNSFNQVHNSPDSLIQMKKSVAGKIIFGTGDKIGVRIGCLEQLALCLDFTAPGWK